MNNKTNIENGRLASLRSGVWLGSGFISLPVVIECHELPKPWAVSLGGSNPPAELCWECDGEAEAWRLHDAIFLLIMIADPSFAGHAISESMSRSLLDQIDRRAEKWSESGTLQAAQCVATKDC